MDLYCLLLESFSYDCGLAMTAAVTTAAVEAATAANRASATNCTAATNCAAAESTADRYMRSAASEAAGNRAASDSATVPAITTTPAVPAAVTGASPIAGATVEASTKPRAGSDEDAAGEPARAVVTIGRASVWVIPVVAVGANGSWAHVARTDAYTDHDALSISVRR